MKLTVCKFGGTSMANAESIRKVGKIVRSTASRRFVIVSAPGRRFPGDTKLTDELYACHALKRGGGDWRRLFGNIRARFTELAENLNSALDIKRLLDETEREIELVDSADFTASRGEYIIAKITAEFLGFDFVDAADIIKFDENGDFDVESTDKAVFEELSRRARAVIPGFYGTEPNGSVKTFTRGGGDFTGAIVARGVKADLYENWTDVDGFMTADPSIVENPRLIDELSYEELRELSYMGASVLHPESTFPLRNTDIPIRIKNTFNPSAKGTFISGNVRNRQKLVTGIAGMKGFTTFLIHKNMMNSEIGFCRKILSIMEENGIRMEHMPTGIDTVSLIIPDADLSEGAERKLIGEIGERVNPDRIRVYKNISLIAVVGLGMSNRAGTAAKAFSALAEGNINVRMIDQGSSELNIIIGVDTADLDRAIKILYGEFFGK